MNAKNLLGNTGDIQRRLEQIAKDPTLNNDEKLRESAKVVLPVLKKVNSFFVLAIAASYIKTAYAKFHAMAATKDKNSDAVFDKMAQDLKLQFYKAAAQLETRHATKKDDLAEPDSDATLKAKIEARDKRAAAGNVDNTLIVMKAIQSVLPPGMKKLVETLGPGDEAALRKHLSDSKRLSMEQKIAIERASILSSPDAEIAAFCHEVGAKMSGEKIRGLFNAVAKNVSGDDLGALVTKGVPFATKIVEDVARDRFGKGRPTRAGDQFQAAVKRVTSGLEKAVIESGILNSNIDIAAHMTRHLKAVEDVRNGFLKP